MRSRHTPRHSSQGDWAGDLASDVRMFLIWGFVSIFLIAALIGIIIYLLVTR